MLLAEAADDHAAFRRVWGWTRDHLQLRSGLFAFHANAAGQVISREPASDADLIIAWALLPVSRSRGGRLSPGGPPRGASDPGQGSDPRSWRNASPHRGALGHRTAREPGSQLLVTGRAAGPCAAHRPAGVAQPGVGSRDLHPPADPRWPAAATRLGAAHRRRGAATRTGSGRQPAADPVRPGRAAHSRLARSILQSAGQGAGGRLLRPANRSQALALRPDGTVLDGTAAPLPLAASAAAAKAAGKAAAARHLLDRAATQQRSHPTYYGGAWLALGRALLLSGALGTCLMAHSSSCPRSAQLLREPRCRPPSAGLRPSARPASWPAAVGVRRGI